MPPEVILFRPSDWPLDAVVQRMFPVPERYADRLYWFHDARHKTETHDLFDVLPEHTDGPPEEVDDALAYIGGIVPLLLVDDVLNARVYGDSTAREIAFGFHASASNEELEAYFRQRMTVLSAAEVLTWRRAQHELNPLRRLSADEVATARAGLGEHARQILAAVDRPGDVALSGPDADWLAGQLGPAPEHWDARDQRIVDLVAQAAPASVIAAVHYRDDLLLDRRGLVTAALTRRGVAADVVDHAFAELVLPWGISSVALYHLAEMGSPVDHGTRSSRAAAAAMMALYAWTFGGSRLFDDPEAQARGFLDAIGTSELLWLTRAPALREVIIGQLEEVARSQRGDAGHARFLLRELDSEHADEHDQELTAGAGADDGPPAAEVELVRLAPPRPPRFAVSSKICDPVTGQVMLAARASHTESYVPTAGSIELWSFAVDAGTWSRGAVRLFAGGEYFGAPSLWIDPERGLSIGCFARGGRLHVVRASDPRTVAPTEIVVKGAENEWQAGCTFDVTRGGLVVSFAGQRRCCLLHEDGRVEELSSDTHVTDLVSVPGTGLFGLDEQRRSVLQLIDGAWCPFAHTQIGFAGLTLDPVSGELRVLVNDGVMAQLARVTFDRVQALGLALPVPYAHGPMAMTGHGDLVHVTPSVTHFSRAGRAFSDRALAEVGGDNGSRVLLTTPRTALVAVLGLSTVWDAEHWRSVATVERGGSYHQVVGVVAWASEVYSIDAGGEVRRAALGEPFAVVGGADQTLGDCNGKRFAWDPVAQRIVMHGGVGRNDTWVWSPGAPQWRELRPGQPPPHGAASLASTPHGVYALVQSELHLLVGDTWRCVAARVPGVHLAWDPTRDVLISVGGTGVYLLDAHAPARRIAVTPASFMSSSDQPAAAVDAAHDRLLVLAEATWALSLSAAIGARTATIALAAVEPPSRRLAHALPGWSRAAWRCLVTEAPAEALPELPGILLAVLPVDEALAREGFTGIAITREEEPYTSPNEPWRLDGGGFHATLLRDATVAPLAMTDNGARVLASESIDDLDPELTLFYDTPPGTRFGMNAVTKVGGFPSMSSPDSDPMAGWSEEPLRFVAQLVGDVASYLGSTLLVYVSEAGSEAPRAVVVLQ